VKEIAYGGAFTKELRIRGHAETYPGIAAVCGERRCSCSPVEAGTVLFSMTSFGDCASEAITLATLSIAERSASPDSSGGVPTHMNTASLARTASPQSNVKRRRPELRVRSITPSKPGS